MAGYLDFNLYDSSSLCGLLKVAFWCIFHSVSSIRESSKQFKAQCVLSHVPGFIIIPGSQYRERPARNSERIP
jgi:hypothetical protein